MEYRFNTTGSINQDIQKAHATIRKNEMDDPRKQQPNVSIQKYKDN